MSAPAPLRIGMLLDLPGPYDPCVQTMSLLIHSNVGANPLCTICRGGANPKSIKIDIAHTYAIAGYGKDDLASCLVFLAVRCEIWGPGRYEDQLERAWVSFKTWCVANKRSTTILEFSKKELKITSQLGQCLRIFLCGQGCVPCPKEMNRLWDHCFKSAFLELAEAARLSERSWERIRHSSGGSLVGECPIRCGFRPG